MLAAVRGAACLTGFTALVFVFGLIWICGTVAHTPFGLVAENLAVGAGFGRAHIAWQESGAASINHLVSLGTMFLDLHVCGSHTRKCTSLMMPGVGHVCVPQASQLS